MYTQIYTKKTSGTGVVTFPNHAAIEQMKQKNTQLFENKNKMTDTSSKKEHTSTEDILLLTAMLTFTSDIDKELFPIIAAAIICA